MSLSVLQIPFALTYTTFTNSQADYIFRTALNTSLLAEYILVNVTILTHQRDQLELSVVENKLYYVKDFYLSLRSNLTFCVSEKIPQGVIDSVQYHSTLNSLLITNTILYCKEWTAVNSMVTMLYKRDAAFNYVRML
jgi:hypothetical protein